MAATTDSAVTNGRARTSANSIVVAGDRTASRRTAHRHSKSVRTLKFALPIAALATLAIFAGSIFKSVGFGPAIPNLNMPQIIADNLKMQNPHYEGFNADEQDQRGPEATAVAPPSPVTPDRRQRRHGADPTSPWALGPSRTRAHGR